MNSRRIFLKQSMLGAGSMALGSGLFAKSTQGNPPKRFIFIHKGNGLFPRSIETLTISFEEMEGWCKSEANSRGPNFYRLEIGDCVVKSGCTKHLLAADAQSRHNI